MGRWATFARLARRFARDERGATVVEFALVATPFFALLYAIFATAVLFLAQQVLQTATTNAARLVMTGQAQSQKLNASQFQAAVCAKIPAMFTCSGIYVNVQKFSSFGGVTPLNPVSGGTFNNAMNYNLGSAGDIIIVQVFYQWPEYVGLLGFNQTNMTGNFRLIQATAVFRNEPYGTP